MAIYFGSTGFIELKRDALNSDLETSLDPADVNITKKRFSVDKASGSASGQVGGEGGYVGGGGWREVLSRHLHPQC